MMIPIIKDMFKESKDQLDEKYYNVLSNSHTSFYVINLRTNGERNALNFDVDVNRLKTFARIQFSNLYDDGHGNQKTKSLRKSISINNTYDFNEVFLPAYKLCDEISSGDVTKTAIDPLNQITTEWNKTLEYLNYTADIPIGKRKIVVYRPWEIKKSSVFFEVEKKDDNRLVVRMFHPRYRSPKHRQQIVPFQEINASFTLWSLHDVSVFRRVWKKWSTINSLI